MDDTLHFLLPAEEPAGEERVCRMSPELFQNARQTMGELRDMMREQHFSWDFIKYQIEAAQSAPSPLDKALRQMDDYSIGIGKHIQGTPKNEW